MSLLDDVVRMRAKLQTNTGHSARCMECGERTLVTIMRAQGMHGTDQEIIDHFARCRTTYGSYRLGEWPQ